MSPLPEQKSCSICRKAYPSKQFNYGNRENRSYCQSCNQQERAAYSRGGAEAARAFRDEVRRKWAR